MSDVHFSEGGVTSYGFLCLVLAKQILNMKLVFNLSLIHVLCDSKLFVTPSDI